MVACFTVGREADFRHLRQFCPSDSPEQECAVTLAGSGSTPVFRQPKHSPPARVTAVIVTPCPPWRADVERFAYHVRRQLHEAVDVDA
jgi:hypothetical protein